MSEDQDYDAEFEPAEAPERAAAQAPERPAWVKDQVPVTPPRPARVARAPVPGRHEDDGLWEHVLLTGGTVAVIAFLAAVMLPRAIPLWMITSLAATVAAVTGWLSLSLTGSGSMAGYLAVFGAVITGWLTAARMAGPWHAPVIFALVLPMAVLIPAGVTVIRRHRDRANRAATAGTGSMHVRECRYWEGLLAKLGCANVMVRDITLVDGGRMVHCRLKKAAEGRRISAVPDAEMARQIAVQRLLRPGSVYIEAEPEGLTAADFVIHVREKAGPRLTRFIPADNSPLSINEQFAVGVLDTGRPWRMKLREIVTFVCGVRGSGKALDVNTRIATPSGWTIMGEIQPGDQVFDEAGRPCRVLAATEVMHGRPCYEIEFSDGTIITADRDHLWLVDTDASRRSARRRTSFRPRPDVRKSRDQEHRRQRPEILTTGQMIPGQRMLRRSGAAADGGVSNYSVQVAAPLQCPEARLAVPPYTLGAWLGDGHTGTSRITSADPEILTEIEAEGETVRIVPSTIRGETAGYTIVGLLSRLRSIGIFGKHIPVVYQRAAEKQRRALLAGLLDTDGSCIPGGTVEYYSSRERLARDVYQLVCGLGYKASLRSKTARLDGRDCGITWTVAFTPAEKVFRLPRKLARQVTRVRSTATHRYITAIRPVPSVPVRCIQVDSPSQLYLAGESCVPTHNSTLLNVIIAQLARMPDSLIFVIDLKGGQETMAWLLPWLQGIVDKPVIDWLATTREEADIMLDALLRAGVARAESGRYGKKLRPGVYKIDGVEEMCPGIIVICDETAEMTGHMLREGDVSSRQLSTKLVRISERFRSVAIDPVVAAVRAVVDVTGNSGIKAMSELTIGMKVRTVNEGQAIFHDDYRAAQALARLKDKGMFIPKEASQLFPPVHGYNITDGTPLDDGTPTEDLITPIAIACAARRPDPEQLIADAMGEAYEKRWEQPHIAELLAGWKRQAGIRDRQPPVVREKDDFEDIVASSLSDVFDDHSLVPRDDDEPDYVMEPRLKRMCELLIERGPRGYQPALLEDALAAEGKDVHRGTLMKWLKTAVEKGWVYRHGKERSRQVRYTWILGEGAEFDIPGWR